MKFNKILIYALVSISFLGCNDDSDDSSTESTFNDNYIVTETNTTSTYIPTEDKTTEEKKTPTFIVGVNFNNITIENNENWSNKIFTLNSNSVNDYFKKTSNSSFTLEKGIENYGVNNDGYIEITLDYDHPNPDSINSPDYTKIVYDSYIKSLDFIDNISLYDTDNDNIISREELSFIFIIAGQEQATGETENSVWAHSFSILDLDNQIIIQDGKTLDSHYGLFGENHGDHFATIGIISHEMSHCILNLPDLYNTYNGGYGIGPFGLMALGTWNSTNEFAGDSPKELSAYFKYKFNWVNTMSLINQDNIKLPSSNTNDETILKIPVREKEYFLVENLSNTGYDSGLNYYINGYNGGIAIWHIDENVIDDNLLTNSVNNDVDHKGVDFVEAQTNNMDNNQLPIKEDLFYEGNINTIDDNTENNNLKLYDLSNSNIIIENISIIKDEMTLDLK